MYVARASRRAASTFVSMSRLDRSDVETNLDTARLEARATRDIRFI